MLTFTEAELLAWITPLLWPFLRALALFTSLPVLGQRIVPVRVRIALAFFITVAAQATLPAMPNVPLDSSAALLLAAQQVLIGVALGFAVRVVFAAVEMAGEIIGLWGLAIDRGLPLSPVASMIVAYPTLSEIAKRAAGAYFAPKLFSPRIRRFVRLVQKWLP